MHKYHEYADRLIQRDDERRIRSAEKRIERLDDAIFHIDEAYVASSCKKLLAVKCDLQDEKLQLKNKITVLKRRHIAVQGAEKATSLLHGKRIDI